MTPIAQTLLQKHIAAENAQEKLQSTAHSLQKQLSSQNTFLTNYMDHMMQLSLQIEAFQNSALAMHQSHSEFNKEIRLCRSNIEQQLCDVKGSIEDIRTNTLARYNILASKYELSKQDSSQQLQFMSKERQEFELQKIQMQDSADSLIKSKQDLEAQLLLCQSEYEAQILHWNQQLDAYKTELSSQAIKQQSLVNDAKQQIAHLQSEQLIQEQQYLRRISALQESNLELESQKEQLGIQMNLLQDAIQAKARDYQTILLELDCMKTKYQESSIAYSELQGGMKTLSEEKIKISEMLQAQMVSANPDLDTIRCAAVY